MGKPAWGIPEDSYINQSLEAKEFRRACNVLFLNGIGTPEAIVSARHTTYEKALRAIGDAHCTAYLQR